MNTFWQVFQVQMAFVVIRLIYVDFIACRTKGKSTRDQMGWATAHFQFWVATQRWCRDSRGHGVQGRSRPIPRRSIINHTQILSSTLMEASIHLLIFLQQYLLNT